MSDMKIYLKCGLNYNLGDDLFWYIITNRYNEEFVSITTCKNYKGSANSKIIYINNFINRILNKIAKIFNKRNFIENLIIKKSKLTIIVGGSIFIENLYTKEYINSFFRKLSNFYIIGANIGPYKNQSYLELIENYFNASEDVCLRDKNSYQLVKSCKKVRYAPDIVFSLDLCQYVNNYDKKVIFSVISYKRKQNQFNIKNQMLENNYYQNIIKMINYFSILNYKISLASFCTDEGDMEAIQIILNQIKPAIQKNIEIFEYKGDIHAALEYLSKSEIIVGTRFHANVIGFLLCKKVIPIIYNNKTKNLLVDINFKNYFLDVNSKKSFNEKKFNNKEYIYPNIEKFKKNSIQHFQKLDKILHLKIK